NRSLKNVCKHSKRFLLVRKIRDYANFCTLIKFAIKCSSFKFKCFISFSEFFEQTCSSTHVVFRIRESQDCWANKVVVQDIELSILKSTFSQSVTNDTCSNTKF